MSKIKNDGLDQYGAEPFEHQQFGTAGVERVKMIFQVFQRRGLDAIGFNRNWTEYKLGFGLLSHSFWLG